MLVWCTRKGATTRDLKDEKHVTKVLRTIAEDAGVDFAVFKGGPALEARALFRRAVAVVGVHGAGLTNVLYAPRDALLLELGFTPASTWHFRHLAAALSMKSAVSRHHGSLRTFPLSMWTGVLSALLGPLRSILSMWIRV